MDAEAYVLALSKAKAYTDGVALHGVPINYPQIDAVNKHWKIFNVNTGAYVDTGYTAEGKNAPIPEIGANGNWYIGGQDTNVPARARDVELVADGDYIRWRYVGSTSWHNIVSIDSLKAENGATPEFRVQGNILQIRFPPETEYTNLYTFPDAGSGGGTGGGYEPPEGGISRGDLAEDVRESLDNADEAAEVLSDHIQDTSIHLQDGEREKLNTALQEETDPVYSADKPSIALKTEVSTAVSGHNMDTVSHSDIREIIDHAIDELNQAKLEKTETAANSAKLENKSASEFATAEQGQKADNSAQKDSQGKIPASTIPIAEENTIGGVMPGNGMSIDAQGRLNWLGQVPQISYWISSQNLLTGQIGGAASVFLDSVTKISGTHTEPEQSDVCYSNDGYCFIIQLINTEMNMIDGAIVQIPPPSAIWSNIQGALNNNQIIPAVLADGNGNIGILWLNAQDTVQLGDPSHGVNINSDGRMTNNLKPVALSDELNAAKTNLQGQIDNEITDRQSAFSNLSTTILSEATVRAQADLVLQQNLDAEIQARTQADTGLSSRIDSIIDDSRHDAYNSTLSAKEIINQISKVYQPIPDVPTPEDLPEEENLVGPSICYVDSTETTWINSNTGNGWKDTGANFATTSDIQNYLIDNGYLKQSQIVDNLLSDDDQAPLSARQGKILQMVKIGVDQIINNLLTDDAAKPLSAAMGKWLFDNAFKISDIIDSLQSTLTDKALSANQGRVLNDKITAIQGLFTNGKANQAIQADSALAAAKLSAQRKIKLNLTGYTTGEGEVDTDLAGNVTLNVNTYGMAKSGTNAIIRTEFYVPQNGLTDGGYFKWFTIESSATTQSTLYIKFQHAWHGMIEVFIPFFNYNSNLFIDAAASKWGARRMPGNFGYANRHADYKIRWFRKDATKTEFWVKPNGLNARAIVDLCFEVNGSISEENVTFDPDFLKVAGRKTRWPITGDGYLGGCSEIDTALATAAGGYVYETAITYSTSLT